MRQLNFLLDTHIILWIAINSPKLSEKVKDALLDKNSTKYFSLASAWEVALKISAGKLDIIGGLNSFFEICDENEIMEISLSRKHVDIVSQLPFIHKDPFDRLLIATAQEEKLTLISADKHIQQYDVDWLW